VYVYLRHVTRFPLQGRADNIPNAHHEPVGRYNLHVTVVDQSTQTTHMYNGPATLHLASGMVVLPGMGNPKEKIMPFAMAVAADTQDSANGGKFEPGEDNVAPVAMPVTVAVTSSVAAAGKQSHTTVAFGVQDQALNAKLQPKPRPINPLNPANYF
jgi:hypothetical protein